MCYSCVQGPAVSGLLAVLPGTSTFCCWGLRLLDVRVLIVYKLTIILSSSHGACVLGRIIIMNPAKARIILKPTSRLQSTVAFLLLLFAWNAACFTFRSVAVSMDAYTVGTQTTYYFYLDRQYDDSLATTLWLNNTVPENATASVSFPAEYTSGLVGGAQCADVSVNDASISDYSCALSGNLLIISNAFASVSSVSSMYITIAGIVNPGSTITTSPFTAAIGEDSSGNSSSARVSFTAGQLASLAVSFAAGVVNQTSDMLISFTTGHAVPQNGAIQVTFPITLTWSRDLSASHTIPINGSLNCYGVTTNINNGTISCQGLFATQTVTVATPFSQPLSSAATVTFAIRGLFAPPTTQQVDRLKVTTCDGALNSIDVSSSLISGLAPQTLTTFAITPTVSPFGVNNYLGGLSFTFTLTDTISSSDNFVIAFPSGTSITFTMRTGSIAIQAANYNSTNTSLVLVQSTTNPNYWAGTSITLTFIRYRAPPSTRPTSPITLTIFSFGYSKMTAWGSVSAVANNYTLTVTADSVTVNSFAAYSLSFSMSDGLGSGGYIALLLDPNLCKTASQIASIQSNLTVAIAGSSIKASPSTQIVASSVNGSPTYALVFTNLNNSNANIAAQPLTIKVSNLLNSPSVLSMSQFSLSTYYSSSSSDLVANAKFTGVITLQTGAITLISVSSTATTTYTFGTLTVQLKTQNPIPANGYLTLIFPADLNVLTVYQTTINISAVLVSAVATNYVLNNSVVLKLASPIAADTSLKVIIENAVTQNTTKSTASFVVRSYDQFFNAIDVSTNSLSLVLLSGNAFNALSLSRSSRANSGESNYTLYFQQIQNSSSITTIAISLSPSLLSSSLGRVYQQRYNSSSSSYYLTALAFSKVNGSYIKATLSQPATSHTIILSTIANPPSLQPATNSILLYTLTSDQLYVYSQMYAEDVINDAASTDIVTSFSFSNFAYAQATSLTLLLKQPTDWPTTIFSLQIDIPTSFGSTNVSCSGFSGILCSLFAPTKKLTVTASNSSNLPSPITLVISNLINPSVSTAPETFAVSSYDSANYLVQSDSSTVTFSNKCEMPCRSCSSTNSSSCLSCYTSAISNWSLLYQSQCLSACPAGSHQLNASSCAACDVSCGQCAISSSNCTACSANSSFPLLYANSTVSPAMGSCVPVCPAAAYQLNNSCYNCDSSCSSCLNGSYCSSCKAGYYWYNGSCVSGCPNTTITTNQSCQDCSKTCQTCLLSTDYCTTCPQFTFLSNSTCLTSCPSPNMFVNIARTCQLCNATCLTCSLSAANCTSCDLGSGNPHLYSSTCLTTCPLLYYSNVSTLVCASCSGLGINCSNCSSSNTCFVCDAGYLLFLANSSCRKQIPVGYVAVNGSIYACNSTCASCLGSQQSCTSCLSPLNLYNSQCIPSCPASITVTISNVCQLCLFPCATCLSATNKCTSCNVSSNLYYNQAGSSCVSAGNCAAGTFANVSSLACQNCSKECALCSGLPANCSSCKANYFSYSANNSCLSSCPSRYAGANSTCQPCSAPCLSCNSTQTQCTSCRPSTPQLYLDRNASACVLDGSCGAGRYPNSTSLACQSCVWPCALCKSISVCSSCQGNFSLFYGNGSCLKGCPDGFASLVDGNNSFCQACLNPCATCQGTPNSCASCTPNSSLYLQGSLCVNASSCPNLTYANSTTSKCTPCLSPCVSCTSQLNCSTCTNGTYFYLSSCYSGSSCPSGTVAGTSSSTGLNQCVSCTYPCLSCAVTSTNCSSCNSSAAALYLNGNSCGNASSCPNFTYANSSSNKCTPCPSPCLSCSNSTQCLTCIADHFLSLNATCINQCPSGQYAADVSGIVMCRLCSSGCAGCSGSATNCTSCNNGSYLSGGSCVNASSCPATAYPNISSNICENCLPPCSSCSNSTFCQSCATLFLISSSGLCVNSTACPNGTVAYNSSGLLSCAACDPSCSICQQAPAYCTSCANASAYLMNGSCVNSSGCIAGTYANSTLGLCSKCLAPCIGCSNSTFCSSCQSGLFLVVQTGKCVVSSACPAGTTAYDSNGSLICANCSPLCQSCLGSPNKCTSCPSNSSTYLQNQTCVLPTSCINGTFPDSLTLRCMNCPLSCSLCSANASCSSCTPGFYLLNASCLNSCPDGTLAENASLTCKSCLSPCKTCQDSVSSCSSCQQTNSTLFLQGVSCVAGSDCNKGTYANQSSFSCAACNQNCTTCTALDVCTSCVNGFFLYSSRTCVNVCPDGWLGVLKSGGGVCQQCLSPCLTCNNILSECTSCLQNLTAPAFLSASSCVPQNLCPNSTYANTSNFKCSPCVPQCTSCQSSSTFCLSCSPNFYMLNNSCLSTCPNTTLADTASQSCQICTAACQTCANQLNNCTSCISGTFLLNNTCANSCPNGSAAVAASSQCETCQTGCTTCDHSIQNCTGCSSGFFYYNLSCLQTCPNAYYPNGSANQCAPCTNNCATCSNATTCLSCSAPLAYFSSQCVSSCPSAVPYSLANICVNCSSAIANCLSCSSSSTAASCLSCSSGLLLFNGFCVVACPSGHQSDNKGSCRQTESSVNSTLSGSLTTSGLFPLPFTITGSIIFVACFMSKLQNKNTYIIGVAYALYGFIQTACLAYVILAFSFESGQPGSEYKTFLLVALFAIGGLNVFGLLVQTWQLAHDSKFSKWMKSKCNCAFYTIIVMVSALANYKFKLILFTKLFNFQCVRAQLQHVQKFRLFNLLSFLGVGHQGLILYICALTLLRLSPNTPRFLLLLDLAAVNIVNVILALAASSKSDSFFQQQQQDGTKVNKVFNMHEQYQINPVDDTLDEMRKHKGLDSREIMMDQEDEFTLSISDREESSVKADLPQPDTADKLASFKHNKSMLDGYRRNGLQAKQDRGLTSLSAVFQGQIQRGRRQHFDYNFKPSEIIVQKTEKQSNSENFSLNQQALKAGEGAGSEKNIFDADAGQDVELPEQTNLVPDIALTNGLNADEEAENKLQEQQKPSNHLLNNNQTVQAQQISNVQKTAEKKEEQQLKKPAPRQIKIYKGKGEIPALPQDIQQIDLTISKKQKQLIQLRKSIRRRQKSQEKRSQRSKDKLSKGPQSQKATDFLSNNFIHKMSSQQLLNLKPKIQRAPLNINMLHQCLQSGIIQQALEAAPGSISIARKDRKQVSPMIEEIEDNINEKDILKTPIANKSKIQEIIDERAQKQQKAAPNQNSDNYKIQQQLEVSKQVKKSKKELKYQIQDMNQMYFQSKEIPQNQQLVENILQYQQQAEQQPPFHKNIFQDPKDQSFFSQQPIHKNNEFLGMKAPLRKQKQLIQHREANQPLSYPQLKIAIKIDADQQNTPLKSKKNYGKRGLEGQVPGEETEDFLEPTQRLKVSPNRSHLLKEQPINRNSEQFQELEQTLTVRQPSFKEYTSRKNLFQRPPLQGRPSTSVKTRQIAGFQNIETNRVDNFSKQSSSNWEVPLHTMKQEEFKQFKSKEKNKETNAQRGAHLQSYPSSFSSNQIRIGSAELNDEPQKPTIHQALKTKQRQDSYKKFIQQQQISGENGSSRKSMKSYRSRSIDRQEAQKQFNKGQLFENDDLKQYYQRKDRSKSKSRSRSREGNRSSDKRLKQLQKIYLQRLQFKQ